MTQQLQDRSIRQRDLVPEEKIKSIKCTVIGVGAGGRQVAQTLAEIGVPNLTLVDFDKVEVPNLATQGFFENQLGQFKVDAVAEVCKMINSGIEIKTIKSKFNPLQFEGGVIFSCVDSMAARKQIFESTKNERDLFIDSRTAAEYARIFVVHDDESYEHYSGSLYTDEESFQAGCTTPMTIYSAKVSANLRVAQFVKWLRGCALDKEIEINLLTNEMRAK